MPSLEPAASEHLSDEQACLVRNHLAEVIGSSAFEGSRRSQSFLKIVVEHALASRFDALRERMLGAEMFGRPVGYDTANDAVVRVKASEVRKRLLNFYRDVGVPSSVRIEIPAGSYVPRFRFPIQDEPLREQPIPQISLPGVGVNRPLKTRRFWDESISSKAWSLFTGACLLLGLTVPLTLSYRHFWGLRQGHRLQSDIHSIAILPLQNLSGDPRQEYFADGMTEELIAVLGQIAPVRVISRTSSMIYKNTNKPLPVIARELGVDAVVEGGVTRENERVHISLQLVDARNDSEIWAKTYDRAASNALSVQGEVAHSIAGEITVNVSSQAETPLLRSRPEDIAAQNLYFQGLQILNYGDPIKAAKYFQDSIDLDSKYAPAHAAIADCFGWQGEAGLMPYSEAFTKQKAEALNAIHLDDSLPEGHAELGSALLDLNWEWDNAEKEFRRAIELNPSSASARRKYVTYLLRSKHIPGAMAEAQLELQLDPTNSRAFVDVANAYYVAHDYDKALEQMEKAAALETDRKRLAFSLGVIYREKGMYEESILQFQNFVDEPHALGHMGNAYTRSGRSREALSIVKRIEQHIKDDGIGRYELALVYAGLGDKAKALEWLEQAYEVHDVGNTFLLIDPCMDALRSDPRFTDLLRRVGFPTSR